MNEQYLYMNPVMRGYLKFYSSLQGYNYMNPKLVQNEINLKLKICDILDRFLDMRQNFMLQNAIVFFKYYVLKGDHEENNETLMKRRL